MSMREDQERREYYRIADTMALEFAPLDEAAEADADTCGSPLFNLLADLHLAEYEAQHLLRNIGERDRTLANYLKTLNRRIDLLGQALAQSLLRDISAPRSVNISEGGISFQDPQAVPEGSLLALRLVLLPQAMGLCLRGRVVHCSPIDQGGYEIGIEFEALSDAQRQLLARHILQRQAQERRLARENADPL